MRSGGGGSDDGQRDEQLLMVFPLDMAAHYLRSLELCRKLIEQFKIVFAPLETKVLITFRIQKLARACLKELGFNIRSVFWTGSEG